MFDVFHAANILCLFAIMFAPPALPRMNNCQSCAHCRQQDLWRGGCFRCPHRRLSPVLEISFLTMLCARQRSPALRRLWCLRRFLPVPSQRLRPGEQARQTVGGLPFHRLRLRWRRLVVRLFLEAEVVSSLDRCHLLRILVSFSGLGGENDPDRPGSSKGCLVHLVMVLHPFVTQG